MDIIFVVIWIGDFNFFIKVWFGWRLLFVNNWYIFGIDGWIFCFVRIVVWVLGLYVYSFIVFFKFVLCLGEDRGVDGVDGEDFFKFF